MTPFGWLDGVLDDLDALRVSVAHRGFVYGDGVFTTFRVVRGVLPRSLPLHFERLEHDAAALGLSSSKLATDLREAARACAQRLAATSSDAVLRVLVARDGSLGPLSRDAASTVVAIATPWQPAANDSVTVRLLDRTTRTPRKSLSYAPSLDAVAHARAMGDDTAVWLDVDGALCEAATASLFIERAGVLCTPPLSLGIVPGTTRTIAIHVARALGVPVRETMLFPNDAYLAHEAFLASAVRGIAPIRAFDGRTGSLRVPGPLTRRIADGVADWLDAKLEVEVSSVFR